MRSKQGEEYRQDVAIGYAGASALVALSVLSFTNHVFQRLRGDSLPSIDQIANFLSQALRASMDEYREHVSVHDSKIAFLVGTYNHELLCAEQRQITLCYRDGQADLMISEPEHALTVVSGPDAEGLQQRIEAHLQQCTFGVELEHSIASELEYHAREHSFNDKPFGGQLQACLIGQAGVKLAAMQYWDKSYRREYLPDSWTEGDYRSLMLGYDVFDLRVGQCDFIVQELLHLPDADNTSWAKGPLKSESRQFDDEDVFSRPRTGVITIP